MIDLKKLEAKFEALLNEETEESFNNWLADKQHREVQATHWTKLPDETNKHT